MRMLTDAAKELIGHELKREHLCMVRIEAKFREIVVIKKRFRRAKTKRVCDVTAFLRFDQNPDIDFVQVTGSPWTFYDDGNDLELNLPPVLVTIS